MPSQVLSDLLPDNKYRALLCQHLNKERCGHLPPEISEADRQTICGFFLSYKRPIYFSAPFFIPSLCWRALRMQAESRFPELRWAIGLLVFERHDCAPDYEWDAAETKYPEQSGRPGRFLGLIHLNPELLRQEEQQDASNRVNVCIGEAHLALPSAYRRGNWHACQHVAGTEYGLPGFFAISGLFKTVSLIDCSYYAVHSALMMLSDRLKCRPLGTLDIVKHALAVLRSRIGTELSEKTQEELQIAQEELQASEPPHEPRWVRLTEKFGINSPFDLLAEAISHDPWQNILDKAGTASQQFWLPASFTSDLFNAGAVAETIACGSVSPGSEHISWNEADQIAQEFWERLVDYLSDGFPVVLAAEGEELPEYVSLLQNLGRKLTEPGEKLRKRKASTDEDTRMESRRAHAFLVYGYHLAQPNNFAVDRFASARNGPLSANGLNGGTAALRVTRLQQVDKYLVTDLAWCPLVEVAATNLFRAATLKPPDKPKQQNTAIAGQDSHALHFLVVLPKGVTRSIGDARKQAMWIGRRWWASGAGEMPAPMRRAFEQEASTDFRVPAAYRDFFLLRTALYEKQTAWYRFREAIESEEVRQKFAGKLGLREMAGKKGAYRFDTRSTRSHHVFAVEFHRTANQPGEKGPFSQGNELPGNEQCPPYLVVLLDAGTPSEQLWEPIVIILPHCKGGIADHEGKILVGDEEIMTSFNWEKVRRV